MSQLARAVELAAYEHRDQKDLGGKPYILHLLRVMLALEEHGEEAMIAGVLHDLIEDTPYNPDRLREDFGETVYEAVIAVTHDDDEESYEDYIVRVGKHPLGRLIKIADIRDNSRPERLAAIKSSPESRAKRAAKYKRNLEYLEGLHG